MSMIIDTRNDDPAITRNVVNSIIKTLSGKLSLPQLLRIEYWGDIGSAPQSGSSTDGAADDVKLVTDGKITVDVDEDYDEDSLINHAVKQREEPAYWVDPLLKLMLRPVRTQSMVQMSFTYRAPTRTAANRFRNSIKMLAAGGRETHLHELQYHIPMPHEFIILAGDVHNKRELQGGYGDKFGKYLKDHTHATITTISIDGSKPTLVISERQLPVLGWFGEIVVSKLGKDDESPTYTVTFDYNVQYQRIIGFVIDYPLMVHNQLLDGRLWDDAPRYALAQRSFRPGVMQDHTVKLQNLFNPPKPNIAGVRIPEFDPWLPKVLPSYTISMMTILLGIDPPTEPGPIRLMSFGDLGGYGIDDKVYDFIKDEVAYLTKRYKSFFQLDLYRNDNIVEMPVLECKVEGDDLVAYLAGDFNVRDMYHVRLSTVMDWDALDERAREAMKKHGEATYKILSEGGDEGGTLYGPSLKPEPDFIYGTYLPGDYIEKELGKWLPTYNNPDLGADFRLVQFLSIISRPRGN